MKTQTYEIEVITPCFCGSAEPEKRAEIRAPSIRGQLRWWFRTLGGFKSLANQGRGIREQENMIFGSVSGGEGYASRLIARVKAKPGGCLNSTQTKDADTMNARVDTDRGYLLFPLRNKAKAVFDIALLPRFELHLVWRGESALLKELDALVTVFGSLGALGFRSRRAMGALAMVRPPMSIVEALSCFSSGTDLVVRAMNATDGTNAVTVLARWLKSWRSHGRTGDNYPAQQYPGFRYAKADHDAGAGLHHGPCFRPAIGLPIVQWFSGGRPRKNWDYGPGKPNNPKGRFASPVILRPHRDAQGIWHALVIFVDAHKWPAGKQVFLNGEQRTVSLDLYDKMKNDPNLKAFL